MVVSNDAVFVRLHIDPGTHASSPLEELSEPIRVSIDGRELPIFSALGADHKHYLRVEFSEPGNLFETILTRKSPKRAFAFPPSPLAVANRLLAIVKLDTIHV